LLKSLFSSFAKSSISIFCHWVIFLQTINHQAVLGFLFFPYNCHHQESEFWAIRSFREWIHRCNKGKNKGFTFFKQKHRIERWETPVHKMRSKRQTNCQEKIHNKS
jgi:hypothetical protein